LPLAQLNDLGQELLAKERRRWGLFCMPKRHAERRLGRDIARQLRRAARAGRHGPGPLMIHSLGGRKPVLSLRLAQLQRVSQQPHSIKVWRPHLAGLKVTYCALAQVSPCCQLLL
jgi:hypothetical protein